MCDSLLAESAMNQTTDTRSEFPIPGTSYSDSYLLSPNGGNLSTEQWPGRHEPCLQRNNANLFRFQLEEDVQRLQKHLLQEMELHSLLEIALEKNTLKLSSPSHIPHCVQELLHNIAFLEAAISKLERQMVSLHFQLSQERNERRLAEYRLRCSSCQSISLGFSDIAPKMNSGSLRSSEQLNHEVYYCDGNGSGEVLNDPSSKCAHVCEESAMENTANSPFNKGEELTAVDSNSCQHMKSWKLPGRVPVKGLWDQPNQLSEEMVRCMKNIFLSLAESAVATRSSLLDNHHSQSPRGHHPNSLSWALSQRSTLLSWVQSPQVDQSSSEVLASGNTYDPYFVRGKLSWADIGSYGSATEVSWMSVGEKQLDYAAGALRRFRTLVEQLAKVNPIHLSSNEKLAFWINLYNALIMHAYLAYGVPRSDLKLFSLMQKAAYTVGGHSFNAAAIEYVILRMKPPVHRPQLALLLALQKMKVTEEQKKFAMDSYEPLAGFALSCGMYSSPAVKIYTAKNVRQELQDARHDFIRASVGVSSKGKLLLPKMLHCLVKGTVDDANLAVWISHYLPPHQAAFVEHCISHRRQRFLGSRNCGIIPFDSRFRYLFLPDRVSTLDVPVLDDLNNHAEPQS